MAFANKKKWAYKKAHKTNKQTRKQTEKKGKKKKFEKSWREATGPWSTANPFFFVWSEHLHHCEENMPPYPPPPDTKLSLSLQRRKMGMNFVRRALGLKRSYWGRPTPPLFFLGGGGDQLSDYSEPLPPPPPPTELISTKMNNGYDPRPQVFGVGKVQLTGISVNNYIQVFFFFFFLSIQKPVVIRKD